MGGVTTKIMLSLFAAAALAWPADFPSAEISNGVVRMKFYTPSAENGSYRGTRFDWSGIAYSIAYKGHEFAGRWYPTHDPKIHDALTGPVEEFMTPTESAHGYDEAKPGEPFVRIGIGTVRRPAGESAYKRFATYDIVDPGKWTVSNKPDSITFVHELAGPGGYAYRYTKTVRLTPGQPEFVIEHRLENTGTRAIDTLQYNHNFFTIDDSTIGPGVRIVFSFEPKAQREMGDMATIRGRAIEYLRDLKPGGESAYTAIEGFGPAASDYDFTIENRRAGAAVHIRGDRPLARVYFWSIRTVACPEPYIRIQAEPGQSATWKITYNLSELPR